MGSIPAGVKASAGLDALNVVASADVAYSFGDFAITGGVGLSIPVYQGVNMKYSGSGTTGEMSGSTGKLGIDITPRLGVAYSF